MENPIRIDDLGVPLFLETSISNEAPCFDFKHLGASHFTQLPQMEPLKHYDVIVEPSIVAA